VVDLEDLAKHKGSAFGNIGMPAQPSQEMFENLLSRELHLIHKLINQPTNSSSHVLTNDYFIWLEDESQRIGDVNLPHPFWKTMRESPVYFLDIPFEERLKHIVVEYGGLDREKVAGAIERIQKRLGGLETKTALQQLKEGDIEGCFRILLKYYDKWYTKGLHNREDLKSLLNKIDCELVDAEISTKRLLNYK
jgi:tRNA 2-selenouridine synthase